MLFTLFLMSMHPHALPVVTADPIAEAFTGLNAAVEDDLGGGDVPLLEIRSKDCASSLISNDRKWTIDWTKAETVALADTFIFLTAPGLKVAIVGDASKPDQAEKLKNLAGAMMAAKKRCDPANSPSADLRKPLR